MRSLHGLLVPPLQNRALWEIWHFFFNLTRMSWMPEKQANVPARNYHVNAFNRVSLAIIASIFLFKYAYIQ